MRRGNEEAPVRALRRNLLRALQGGKTPPHLALPILVRLCERDGVWNVGAFDLPVAAFGNTLDEARKNFEEALDAHFELLVEMKRAKAVIERLRRVARDRGFYDRIKPRETVEKFILKSPQVEMCLGI
jgi:predicted RNase H-like HicB family nuclease